MRGMPSFVYFLSCGGGCSFRLWCVTEVDEAHDQDDVLIRSAMSEEYIDEMERRVRLFIQKGFKRVDDVLEAAGVSVHTIQAKCGYAGDEEMLIEIIKKKEGGFTRLDTVVQEFRKKELPEEIINMLEEMRIKNREEDEKSVYLAKLSDENRNVRRGAVEQLGKLPQEVLVEFAPQLALMLKDRNWEARHTALQAMGKLPQEALVECAPQVALMLQDSNEKVRIAATEAMGKLPKGLMAQFAPQLEAMMQDSNWQARRATLQAMVELPQGELVQFAPQLEAMLQDSNWPVRRAAVATVGKLPQLELVGFAPQLADMLQDNNGQVRKVAVQAMGELSRDVLVQFAPQLWAMLQDHEDHVGVATVGVMGKLPQEALMQFAPQTGYVVASSGWCTHGAPAALATVGKVWYEVKLLSSPGPAPQLGWALPTFSCCGCGNGAGDDSSSWAVDGVRGLLWHGGENIKWQSPNWVNGDIIGIAADLDNGEIWCAQNGSWMIAFQNLDLAKGVFPVVSCQDALVSINLGEQALQCPPPSDEFISLSSVVVSSDVPATTVSLMLNLSRKDQSDRAGQQLIDNAQDLMDQDKDANSPPGVKTAMHVLKSFIRQSSLCPLCPMQPSLDTLIHVRPAAEIDYRARVIEIYTVHNPEKLGKVDSLLESYVGREQELVDKLNLKYEFSAADLTKFVQKPNDTEKKKLDAGSAAVAPAATLKAPGSGMLSTCMGRLACNSIG